MTEEQIKTLDIGDKFKQKCGMKRAGRGGDAPLVFARRARARVIDRGYRGTIYWDKSSKGTKHGRNVNHKCYRACIQVMGVRYSYRSRNFHDCELFLIRKSGVLDERLMEGGADIEGKEDA